MQQGFYVDEGSGKVKSTEQAPDGCHFEFHDKGSYVSVWIVADSDGEVLQENVLWPSLTALSEAGVDVTIQ